MFEMAAQAYYKLQYLHLLAQSWVDIQKRYASEGEARKALAEHTSKDVRLVKIDGRKREVLSID